MKMSESIASLAKALSLFQGETKDTLKDKKGFNYSYADLGQTLEVVRPLLLKNGLSISQLLGNDGDKVGVETILMHESGEFISSFVSVPVERPPLNKNGKESMTMIQAAGSIITYLRRYALTSILGITQTDDDGEMVSNGNNIGHTSYQGYAKGEEYSRSIIPLQGSPKSVVTVSEDEKVKHSTYAKLCSDMMSYGTSDETIEKWKAHFGVTMLDQLSQKQALSLIKRLNAMGMPTESLG